MTKISHSEFMPFIDTYKLEIPPYSEASTTNWNFDKSTEVYCATCEYRTKTNIPAPKCGTCHNPLLVVVRSMLTQEMKNELGRDDSPST